MTDLFTNEFEDQPITNQPGWIGRDTGWYHTNYHGCWHKVEVVSGQIEGPHNDIPIGGHIYMIGEYPEQVSSN